MTKSQKQFILTAFRVNEEEINRVISYMNDAIKDCNRVHSANGKNISGYAANLAEYKGVRNGMISMLVNLGVNMKFDGETLVDIDEMEDKKDSD